jgi:hypothetical protein
MHSVHHIHDLLHFVMPGSQAGSERSHASLGSQKGLGRYKVVSRGGSHVDEALFGHGNTGSIKTTGTINGDQLASLIREGPTKVQTDSLVISRSELERMKNAATVNPLEAAQARRKAAEEAQAEAAAAARERKKMMQQKEEQRRLNAPKSDLELENEAANDELRRAFQRAKDEQNDDVKHMNRMMAYSKCVTIRDAQLLEKQLMASQEAQLQHQLDLEMEKARQESLRLVEEREKVKAADRLKGAEVLKMQLAQREAERLRLKEMADQERDALLIQIERSKEEEKAREEKKREQGKRMLEEAALANREQLRRKEMAKKALMEEEERIAAYVRDKAQKEAERQAELDRIAAEKAMEVARLRAMQEKAADTAAAGDALRARRAQEDYEREWRRKERAAAEKKAAQLQEIMASRTQQAAEKQAREAIAARQAEIEFGRILMVQKAAEKAEREKEMSHVQAAARHRDEVLRQVEEIEEKRRRERQEFLDEGNKIRDQQAKELKRLQNIKDSKIQELVKRFVRISFLNCAVAPAHPFFLLQRSARALRLRAQGQEDSGLKSSANAPISNPRLLLLVHKCAFHMPTKQPKNKL